MKKNGIKKTLIPAALVLLAVVVVIGTIDKATEKIMPFVSDNSYCLECHSREELDTRYKDPAIACDDYCSKCHKEKEAHHPVGMEVTFDIPDDILLRGGDRLVCVSCHDLKTQRMDDKPWKAKSLFGRIFRRQADYKTYYLIKNNSKGKLCKYCH
jgi:hypothetical protein